MLSSLVPAAPYCDMGLNDAAAARMGGHMIVILAGTVEVDLPSVDPSAAGRKPEAFLGKVRPMVPCGFVISCSLEAVQFFDHSLTG